MSHILNTVGNRGLSKASKLGKMGTKSASDNFCSPLY